LTNGRSTAAELLDVVHGDSRDLSSVKDESVSLARSGHVVSPANAVHSERNSKVPGNLGILIVETVEARRFDTTACSGEAPIADENESLKEPGREFSRVQHEGK